MHEHLNPRTPRLSCSLNFCSKAVSILCCFGVYAGGSTAGKADARWYVCGLCNCAFPKGQQENKTASAYRDRQSMRNMQVSISCDPSGIFFMASGSLCRKDVPRLEATVPTAASRNRTNPQLYRRASSGQRTVRELGVTHSNRTLTRHWPCCPTG